MSLPKSMRYDARQQAWVGKIDLPIFDRCTVQWEVNSTRIMPATRKSRGKSRTGRFALSIEDPSKAGPTAAQQAAVEHLQTHEQGMFDAVMRMALRQCRSVYYRESLPAAKELDGEMRQWRARFEIRAGFEQLLRLTGVTVLQAEKRRISYVSFDFYTPLDAEHGISILMHRTKAIGFAGAGECGGGVPPEQTELEKAESDHLLHTAGEYLDSLRQVVNGATAKEALPKIRTAKKRYDASLAENQMTLLTDRRTFDRYTQLAQQCIGELHRICQKVPEAVGILDEVLKRDEAWKRNKKLAKGKR